MRPEHLLLARLDHESDDGPLASAGLVADGIEAFIIEILAQMVVEADGG